MKCRICGQEGEQKHYHCIRCVKPIKNNKFLCDKCAADDCFIETMEEIINAGWLKRDDANLIALEVTRQSNGCEHSMVKIVLSYDKDIHDGHNQEVMKYVSERDILFNHEAAKYIFGEHTVDPADGTPIEIEEVLVQVVESWKYHLQQMVLRENPKLYLLKYKEKEDGSRK